MRRNHRKTDPFAAFDTDYIFRPDYPRLERIINYPRRLILINMDADPDADEVQVIDYGDDETLWDELTL